ncbi:hypothetical protein COX86_01620 [Candidatus Micrarchaeota archaeon CG_4_10_14_0_2_um_filter_60_11]|nr:MAG: hypothetical protein AUJ16_03835 [Candidatus Micrarchaeota archaeon CG1_02_60_51]PIY91763.1 MAG: hypothetical protein COY71_01355 [Candidatus Micrarchaeota archaeon CG_4_10_14_0_8_um_filter_60_7]PIZ91065.1 MAG: hypothetical protein COX86_01620 [Candidatus Micrarchaeota archaeon CG_4_10_14_0_2_um_filter_60_11]
MKLGKTFYAADRKAWRAWLAKNGAKEREVWLVYYRKHSGKPRVSYNDAVDEALCFGWIDGTVKRIDGERYAQRFTPRRANSQLSQLNKERVRVLIAQKRMTQAGLKAIAHAYDAKADHLKVRLARDVSAALRKNPAAWKHFKKFPEGYKRIRVAYIEGQRHYSPESFRKRLAHFVRMTAQNKRFGFVRD